MMKMSKASLVLLFIVGAYVILNEIRMSNLEAMSNLQFDVSACALSGSSQSEIDRCLAERGYTPRPFDSKSEIVEARVLPGLKKFYALILYDKKWIETSIQFRSDTPAL
jgi:hypothetical protein